MILIDSNVFLIERFLPRDFRYSISQQFLDFQKEIESCTTIYNVMEICGLASFMLSEKELAAYFYYFDKKYRLHVLYPQTPSVSAKEFFDSLLQTIFNKITLKMSFVDDAILSLAEELRIDSIITWNEKHFLDRTSITVCSPEDFLKSSKKTL